MLTAHLALIVGCTIWCLGLRNRTNSLSVPFTVNLEYWWALIVIFSGILGTLVTIPAFSLGPEPTIYLRASGLVAVGALMVLRTLFYRPTIAPAGAALFILFTLLFTFAAGSDSVLLPLLSFIIYLPGIIVPSQGYSLKAIKTGVRHGTMLALAVLAMITVFMPNDVIGKCRDDKCSIWGFSLGEAGTGNALGVTLAIVSLISLLTAPGLVRFVLIAAGGFLLVDLTSSRSAIITWSFGLIVVLAYLLTLRTGKLRFVTIATASVGIGVISMPLLGWSDSDFTGRGVLWRYAIQIWQQSPLFGHGASFWVGQDRSTSLDPNYSTHNMFTEQLIGSGVIGVSLFLVACCLAVVGRRSWGGAAYTSALIGLTVLASATEVFSMPGRIYLCAGAMALVFVTSQAEDRPEPNPSQRDKRNAQMPKSGTSRLFT